jgi:hypothetical protein
MILSGMIFISEKCIMDLAGGIIGLEIDGLSLWREVVDLIIIS